MRKNKYIVGLIIVLSAVSNYSAFAQRDTLAYYMTNEGRLAESKEKADFIRLQLPADSTDRDLVVYNDFYMSGKRKLVARSFLKSAYMTNGLQGPYMEYYENGRRKTFRAYRSGKLTGDRIDYYSNGKVYAEMTYDTIRGTLLQACYDSTGKALATDGNGTWIKLKDGRFLSTGTIKDGKEKGEWTGPGGRKGMYADGMLLSGDLYAPEDEYAAGVFDEPAKFPGGDPAFGRFLGRGIRYPDYARDNKITGRVVLSFVVNIDGSLEEMTVLESPHKTLSDEALRVMKTSPKWEPATKNGKPIKMYYKVPIGFSLAYN